ncbi:dicarboxylate/amino acid:cation symporter [Nakamurella endophytica]|uniref:Sodium:proton antiporter n=1 Tax=Nakamurella endophytica TaxID=1748367 RepID=A0A917TCB9_9ACTN|nr:dicarboxylate/amino acid:cation symporter [Nakamurella endophytica]GGM17565.1 sodium:proton antiporter [Nakamurella endophytica]
MVLLRAVRRVPFWAQTLIGLAIGILLGFLARVGDIAWLDSTLTQVGSIFVSLLRAVVAPLILLALLVSISRLGQVTNAARLAVRTVLWFAATALISVVIGMVIGLVTNPGRGTGLSTADAQFTGRSGGWTDFLTGLVPSNFLGLQANTSVSDGAATTSVSFNVLQLVVIGIVLGAAVLRTGAKAQPLVAFADSALTVVQKVLWWIIRLAPIGSAGLIGHAVADYGWDLIGPLGLFVVDVYVGCLIVLFGLYPALLRMHRLRPGKFLAGAWPAITLGFVSRSSVGTMPVTQAVTTRNLGVPQEYASFAVPLGATTKMDGCAAIYPAIAAIFVAQVFGIHLSLTDYLLIAFVSVIGSAATAGLTGAVVMLTLTLSTLGLPLAGVGLLLAIDPILDMMRTATNVAGQALVPVLVAKREGILDLARYDGPNGDGVSDAEPVKAPVAAAA